MQISNRSDTADSGRVQIARRVLKYPPFLTKRKPGVMKITHNLRHGKVEITAPEAVTTEDAEKIFAAVYLAKDVKHVHTDVIVSTCHVAEIRKITNCHNDTYIVHALQRARALTYTFIFPTKTIVTGILHEARMDQKTGVITIMWNRKFFEACREKALVINIYMYAKLSPVTKNLYSFLATNSSHEFSEDVLIERSVIMASRRDKARETLKKALNELVQYGVIKSYSRVKRNKTWVFIIRRPRTELSTAGGKCTFKITRRPAPVASLLVLVKIPHSNIPP